MRSRESRVCGGCLLARNWATHVFAVIEISSSAGSSVLVTVCLLKLVVHQQLQTNRRLLADLLARQWWLWTLQNHLWLMAKHTRAHQEACLLELGLLIVSRFISDSCTCDNLRTMEETWIRACSPVALLRIGLCKELIGGRGLRPSQGLVLTGERWWTN